MEWRRFVLLILMDGAVERRGVSRLKGRGEMLGGDGWEEDGVE